MFGRIRPISAFRKRISFALVQVGERHGFKTQRELAKCLGVNERTLRNWITGRKLVDVEKVSDCEPLRVAFFDALAEGERKAKA